jgi:hypothetical protein
VAGWAVAGAQELAAELAGGAARVEALMPAVVEKSAADLVALTQQNASGRPGPNAPTGDYRGSWRVEKCTTPTPGTVSRSVGTDRAQANRLEYGFVGTDSLGRTYDQPPYPHTARPWTSSNRVFDAAMEAVADQAVRW